MAKNISLFEAVPNTKHVRQMFAHPESVIRFRQSHFIEVRIRLVEFPAGATLSIYQCNVKHFSLCVYA
jgi:hypothetical protein